MRSIKKRISLTRRVISDTPTKKNLLMEGNMKRIVWLLGLFLVICLMFFLFLPVSGSAQNGFSAVAYFDPVGERNKPPDVGLDRMYAATAATIKIKPDFLVKIFTTGEKFSLISQVLVNSPPCSSMGLYCPKGKGFSLSTDGRYENERSNYKEVL